MGLFDFITGGVLGDLVRGPDPFRNPIKDIIKTVETIDAIVTDQTLEGKKDGYSDAEAEYEPIYADLKEKYEKLISDINSRGASLDITRDKGLAELKELKRERDHLTWELKEKADQASGVFHVSSSHILSSLSSGSSSFFSSPSIWGYDIRDSIIEKKKKERMKARKEGYMEAKALYEEKIDQLKAHYKKTKEEADARLRGYADHVSAMLEEIEAVKFQIADLKLAMGD